MPDALAASALVVQTAFLGDVVLTTPLLSVLAERHGPVDVVTTPAAAPLIETHPAVRRGVSHAKRGAGPGFSGVPRLGLALPAGGLSIPFLPPPPLPSAAPAPLAP